MIGDGMGTAAVNAYRVWAENPAVKGIEPLRLDRHLVGAVATESWGATCETIMDCIVQPYAVTDSSASATAYATGRDTLNGMVAQGPDGERFETVLERAARLGKGTGVVSTSQVTHASPASFVAHVPSRRQYAEIADQFYENRVNGQPVAQVILGGGTRDFRREDRDLVQAFVDEAGYTLVEDLDGLLDADDERLLGLFAPVGLPRHWDRPDSVPTLADMTRKAIEVLSRNERGFFLMVEGSQIDWAAHGNDIAGVVSEMEGFADAVDVALDFAAVGGDTLVVITADHETGGLSLGRSGAYEWNPEPLRGLMATPAYMVEAFVAGSDSLDTVLAAQAPFDLSEAERANLAMVEREPRAAYEALNEVLDHRTHSGWTTMGHTGVDVPLYASGPGSASFRGLHQNEKVGQLLMQAVSP